MALFRSPTDVVGRKFLVAPEKLAQAALIHDDSIGFSKLSNGWQGWCKAAGIEIATSHGPRF